MPKKSKSTKSNKSKKNMSPTDPSILLEYPYWFTPGSQLLIPLISPPIFSYYIRQCIKNKGN